ncbi:unnamed protein product [Didymodactylos carnosus]|uniref:GH16 domain-containing protein n=1 Tax=Didymodactylos carnosus TaxID=1234261 RepID=A0A814QRT2_9BILA|nr:unnamed protein product [Didymodactylos carnosus]CAF3886919.1 unnamed protein product [Didymodactylos carnosus]
MKVEPPDGKTIQALNAQAPDAYLFPTDDSKCIGLTQEGKFIVTFGEAFLYGRLQTRAKVPSGKGSWSALWMLAASQRYSSQLWPDNGEIDSEGGGEYTIQFQNSINATEFTFIMLKSLRLG